MNQRQLTYFLEVYKLGSITAAANSLYLSPQGISKTLLSLEEELDVKLFERSGKKMIPTQAAIRLTSHAQTILDEFHYILSDFQAPEEERKTLRVASCYDFPRYLSAEFFHAFYQQHPEILLSIEELPDTDVLAKLDRNEVETALLPGPLNSAKYRLYPLVTNRLCLLVNKKNPLSKKEILSYSDLKGQLLAVKNRNQFASTVHLNELLSHGINPQLIAEVSDYHIIHDMAENGYAVGMTLDYLAEQKHFENTVIRYMENDSFTKSLYLTVRQDIKISKEALAFQKFLLKYLKE